MRRLHPRPTPTVRPLSDSDFFTWVGLYSQYLQDQGAKFTDERALRTWQSMHRITDLKSLVVERSGHIGGFAFATPHLNALDGFLQLEIGAIYVEQMEADGASLEALFESLNDHAASIGASRLLWRAPSANGLYTRISRSFGTLTEDGTFAMPVHN